MGNAGHEIWDVTDPARPSRLTVVVSGLRDTHKSWWECDTGIAYLVTGVTDWRTRRMTSIYDLSDPAKPVFIRYFGLPGQQPDSTGPVPTDLHGPISTRPKGNRVYFGYGTGGNGILQIVDRNKLLNGPKEPTDANLLYPQVVRLDLPADAGAHTAFPLLGMTLPEFANQKLRPGTAAAAGIEHDHDGAAPVRTQAGRDFIAVVGESLANECFENRQMVRMVDVTVETKPFGVSTWTAPEAGGHFCGRGGRFGTHSSNENMTPIYYNRVPFIAHFNAGVRALDVRDPFNVKETVAVHGHRREDDACVDSPEPRGGGGGDAGGGLQLQADAGSAHVRAAHRARRVRELPDVFAGRRREVSRLCELRAVDRQGPAREGVE